MKDIDSMLNKVESITDEIDELLSNFEDVTDLDSAKLLDLYSERNKYIEFLKIVYTNPDGKDFINKNINLDWEYRIRKILSIDKQQLERIQNVIVDVSGKIKNIVKQKSLLIYTR